jgi:predicted RNA binding protein YcfA (HicA-like mRNA interferase family)
MGFIPFLRPIRRTSKLYQKIRKHLACAQFFAILKSRKVGNVNAREVIKKLKAGGWYELKRKGSSHIQLKHPERPGKVTVSDHKGRDIPRDTLDSIEKQSGVPMASKLP